MQVNRPPSSAGPQFRRDAGGRATLSGSCQVRPAVLLAHLLWHSLPLQGRKDIVNQAWIALLLVLSRPHCTFTEEPMTCRRLQGRWPVRRRRPAACGQPGQCHPHGLVSRCSAGPAQPTLAASPALGPFGRACL